MTTRGYRKPSNTLVLHLDPITWDVLKAGATGSMERAAYLFIRSGLGLSVDEAPAPAVAEDEPSTFASMNFEAFRGLK